MKGEGSELRESVVFSFKFSNFRDHGLIRFCSILSSCKSSFFLVDFHFSILICARPLAPLKFLVDFRRWFSDFLAGLVLVRD
jgi:hypothetical protein